MLQKVCVMLRINVSFLRISVEQKDGCLMFNCAYFSMKFNFVGAY